MEITPVQMNSTNIFTSVESCEISSNSTLINELISVKKYLLYENHKVRIAKDIIHGILVLFLTYLRNVSTIRHLKKKLQSINSWHNSDTYALQFSSPICS